MTAIVWSLFFLPGALSDIKALRARIAPFRWRF
jgi:hypothetical protein